MLPDTPHYMILLFSAQSRIMRDIPCIGIKVILKTHHCQSVETLIIEALHWYLFSGCSKKEVAMNPGAGGASDLGNVFSPLCRFIFLYGNKILLFSVHKHYNLIVLV